MFSSMRDRGAVLSLLLAQLASASYFYLPSSVYSYMGRDLGEDVSGLGALTTAFILGVGPMQIPAGMLASRIGPRKTMIYGTGLCSASCLLSAVPSDLLVISAARFLTGVGMSFLFAPGITLVARYFRTGSEALGIGLFAGAFDLGGMLFVPGLAVLGDLLGWRLSFVVVGLIGLGMALLVILFVPRDEAPRGAPVSLLELQRLLLDRRLLVLGLAALSVQVGWNTVGSFVVYYLENEFGVVPWEAGLVGSLFLLSALLASPLAGRRFASGRPVMILLGGGVVSAFGLGLVGFVPLYGAVLATLIVGAGAGAGFTTAYALAREAHRSDPRYETLSVSWANGISLFGGFWTPVLFSFTAVKFGYPAAWLVSGAAAVPLILPVLVLRGLRAPRRGTRLAAAAPGRERA